MWRTTPVAGVVLLLLSMPAGCAHQKSCCHQSCGDVCSSAGAETALPLVDRGSISADLSALEPCESKNPMPGEPALPVQCRELDAGRCQCLAAAASFLGNSRDAESRRLAQSDTLLYSKRKAEALQQNVLAFRALEERNKSAAQALERFFLLAEAESNRDLLDRSLRETETAIDNLRQLKAQGLQIAADEGVLRRQQNDLRDRLAQLHLSIDRLNGELRYLLGFDVNDLTPIWPLDDLKVDATPVDVEAAVAHGLATRPDVGVVALMHQMLDEDTLPVVTAVLSLTTGATSTLSASRSRGRKAVRSGELQHRSRQTYELLAERHRLAVGEIRLAARMIETHLQQITLARANLESWKQRLDQVNQQRKVDAATPFDVSTARLSLIEAESDLIHQVVAWKIAWVKFREAQGVLAYECGWPMPSWCCEPCR